MPERVSVPAAGVNDFESRVSRAARRFGIKALVDLLVSRGYAREQIVFQGNVEGGMTSLIEAVEFCRGSKAGVVLVTVNLGLLGDSALLPSYFVREVERSSAPEKFYDFIRFFDHRLIRNYVCAVWPEDDPAVYGDYALVQRSLLRMAGFSSVASLHWLVQALFPELKVKVQRGSFEESTSSHAFRTGESVLDGTGILGRVYEADAQGFLVDLIAAEETDSRGYSWATVLRNRLNERLFPLLAPFRMALSVTLEVLSHASWVHLESRPNGDEGYLGYDRIRATTESGHRVILWRGTTGQDPLAE